MVRGFAGYKFVQELKLLKEKMRKWNKEIFGDTRKMKMVILEELKGLEP